MPINAKHFISPDRAPDFDGHEAVLLGHDPRTGLRSIIAIHDTTLGPATGGTRYAVYRSDADALADALRLSRAMTYKCALARVPYGGGKGVIIADPKRKKTAALFRAYGRQVDSLGGRFSTGEDVGIAHGDLQAMRETTRHINGGRGAGDLAPWAARGVFAAMEAALMAVFKTAEIAGRTFAIKGLGKVGLALAEIIARRGGILCAADTDLRRVALARRRIAGIRVVAPSRIERERVDVFSPNALGNALNARSIASLRCRIVCGAANNQLASPDDDRLLRRRRILYVPDYVANAGGLIAVTAEMRPGGYKSSWVEKKIRGIRGTTATILRESERRGIPTGRTADLLAERIIKR